MQRFIEVKALSRRFADVVALNNISLTIEAGNITGLIGPEGAGKTTLMRHLVRLLQTQQGSLTYHGFTQQEIAYMPQRQSLYGDLSISEHLDFFKEMYQLSDEIYTQRREHLLNMTRLTAFASRPAGKLSGGMYKKLGLMCALLQSPKVILLDEPTNGVDPISRKEFWDLLMQLKGPDVIILLSTAYMDEALRCDHVILLDNGQLIGQGKPSILLEESGAKNFDEYYRRASSKLGDGL